ncbi:MAG: adenylate/guanylate cyclase domain-containing protein [Hyphomicrobiales bacterium]
MKHRRWIWALVTGLVLAALASLFSLTPVADRLENHYALGLLYGVRGPVKAPSGVAIAAVDTQTLNWLRDLDASSGSEILAGCISPESADELHQIRGPGSLPRSVHACLLSKLRLLGFGPVAFDILFAVNGERDDDERFASALKEHGKAILLIGFERAVVRDGISEILVEREKPPAELFRDSAAAIAAFVVPRGGGPTYAYWPKVPGFPTTSSLPEELIKLSRPKAPSVAKGDSKRPRYLWLYGPPGTIQTISLPDFLVGGVHASESGQSTAIIVGASDPSATNYPDTFPSFFQSESDAGISGVELAATAYLNLLHGHRLMRLSPYAELILIVLAAVGLGMLARLAPRPALIIIPLIGASYIAIAVVAFSQGRYFLPIATLVFFTLPLAILTAVLIRYQLARTLIMRLAPLPVARRLLTRSSDERDVATSIEATVAFFDLIGSTSIGERLSPIDFSAMLNTYHEIIVSEVGKRGGFVSAFSGDGAMVVFTHADAGPDHATRACQSALGVIAAVRSQNKNYAAKDFPLLALRIGVNSGAVAEAEIGSHDRFNFSVVGDVVNMASRLEQLGKKLFPSEKDVVLVGEATNRQVSDPDLSFANCGQQIIAGREHTERVYRLKVEGNLLSP